MKKTNKEIIDAYLKTGSVWESGKLLGMAGQTVHERLQSIGYKLSNSEWSDDEIEQLKEMVNYLTIAQIANRLGRPYNGVAIKISRLGIGQRYGNNQTKKIPRTGQYKKDLIIKYVKEIDNTNQKITTFAKSNNLDIENLVNAIQRFIPDWYEIYAEKNAVKPKQSCPNCEFEFYPLSHKQIYCTRKCANEFRTDNNYFGGKRKETIGLKDGICQLCSEKPKKGLSSHHMRGKENDPENDFLIALCQGCHQIITITAARKFVTNPDAWDVLIQLALMRHNGADPNYYGALVNVEIDYMNKQMMDEYVKEQNV